MATAIVGGILAIIVGMILRGMIKDRQNGKASCSCGGDCAHCGNCHSSALRKE